MGDGCEKSRSCSETFLEATIFHQFSIQFETYFSLLDYKYIINIYIQAALKLTNKEFFADSKCKEDRKLSF